MRIQAALLSAMVLAACTPTPEGNTTQTARLRNDPPASCTKDQLSACPAPAAVPCADGSQPVLDYSSDCCAHFSCQPACVAAKPCSRGPAPVCPAGTKLWIGTALEDCCPAYRCEPDGACDAAKAVCTLALPYCGPNLKPEVVGQTADCCPIYQCPCDYKTDPASGKLAPDAPSCGCTFPSCAPGEEVVCAGIDPCGGPCKCAPATGSCQFDSECPADSRCDMANCLLPPATDARPAGCDPAKCGPQSKMMNYLCPDNQTMAGPSGRCLPDATGVCAWEIVQCPPPPPTCEVAKCGPALGMPSKLCPDGKNYAGPTGRCLDFGGRCGWEILDCPPVACDATLCGPAPMMPNTLCPDGTTLSGPTGRCLPQADGKCGWEFVECQPTPPDPKCFGVCTPNIQKGCHADSDCPSGQMCQVACTGWGCSPAGSAPCECKPDDPACTCPAPPPPSGCACDMGDPSCKCDPTTGACWGQTCEGQCVPALPTCDPAKAVCPAIYPTCADGSKPVQVGTDPMTCCPEYKCPDCAMRDPAQTCPMIDCVCARVVGTDPASCCPMYKCEAPNADGKCP